MRGSFWTILAALVAAAALPAVGQAQRIEPGLVLDALNTARADPAGYRHDLQTYRGFFHANLVRYPGMDADIQTEEGVAVVDETIAYLGKQPALGKLLPSYLLQAAAEDHLADQQRTGQIGHAGSDGSSPQIRVVRRGGGKYVAEIIAYGAVDAADAMRQLIVDDGVSDRGHRSIIFSAELVYAGAACGAHPVYRTMCVIDLGLTADGRYPGPGLRYSAR